MKKDKTPKIKQKVVVTPQTNIAELVYECPQAVGVLLSFGLHCVGCFASQFDTIEQGAKIHGMTDREIQEIVSTLNKALSAPSVSMKHAA